LAVRATKNGVPAFHTAAVIVNCAFWTLVANGHAMLAKPDSTQNHLSAGQRFGSAEKQRKARASVG
jgi:hypothetical protein